MFEKSVGFWLFFFSAIAFQNFRFIVSGLFGLLVVKERFNNINLSVFFYFLGQ